MIQDQLAAPGRDIANPRVLQAMAAVPRHEFVPPAHRAEAYEDRPLPIGHGQTISQPYIVAFMTEKMDPQPTDRVLEVGTGSGYQSAVLSALVAAVYSVEIVAPLAEQAIRVLRRLGYDNVHVRFGDGVEGWKDHAPYDAVVVTCAPSRVPQPLIDQLKDGGRMIIPVATGHQQELVLLEKRGRELSTTRVLPVRFVPMTGGAEDGPA
jgi:protein-L-isoaspartate(D-aspartate) O-methyltransferase